MGSNSIASEWIAAPARALATSYDKIQNSNKMSRIRQNYREETEALVNQQINIQLTASYAYQAMAAHFDRDDEAGLGYSKFFSQAAEGKRSLAESLIKYQQTRGKSRLPGCLQTIQHDLGLASC